MEITDNNGNYDSNEPNFNEDNQSYVDQYQQEHLGDEATQQEQFLEAGGDYLDDEFSNALERDDQEDTEEEFGDSDLEEDDFEEDETDADDLDDDLVEDYDENDREPDTFTDDSLKID